MFTKLNQQELLEKFFNVNHDFRWITNKKELETLFTLNIVEKILDSKERADVFNYCVQPNLKLSKKVWRALNPKAKNLSKLENKINRPYYMSRYSQPSPIVERKRSEDKHESDDD